MCEASRGCSSCLLIATVGSALEFKAAPNNAGHKGLETLKEMSAQGAWHNYTKFDKTEMIK
jgi:hypothetical protein